MKKTIYLLLVILILILISSTVVLATMSNNGQQLVLTGEKLKNVGETYEEIEEGVATFSLTNTQQRVVSKANEYIEDLNVSNVMFSLENSIVKNYNNALESRTETVISNDDAILKINSESNELIAYISNNTEFEKNTLSKEQVQEKAISIFNNLKNINKVDYELIYIEQFDDEIWRAGFAKKYDGLINDNESIKFSFSPSNNELVTLAINNIAYANNNVVLTENDAREIANFYMNNSEGNDMTIELDIVRPNYFYSELNGDDSIYVKIPETRKAYVARFNNEAESEVYIDATTGEVIGGNMILGGEY